MPEYLGQRSGLLDSVFAQAVGAFEGIPHSPGKTNNLMKSPADDNFCGNCYTADTPI